ncbi:hypothetical protein [Halegenticoccus tardaugens]|uniref:hypothetical protein n=1 Tax=Halegenticoccus tardaugens TaxID=2071624 RepID=UPI00100C0915|nr:hypothetical protein [Halegenticoccus tardaugens]
MICHIFLPECGPCDGASLARAWTTAVDSLVLFVGFLADGVAAAVNAERLYHTSLKSGYIEGLAADDGNEAISLLLLELMPLLGGLAALPVAAAAALWRRSLASRGDLRGIARLGREAATAATPARMVDLFTLTFATLLALLFLLRLPLHAMVTVRYLLPPVPMLVYPLLRVGPVRGSLRE